MGKGGGFQRQCWGCLEYGHTQAECPNGKGKGKKGGDKGGGFYKPNFEKGKGKGWFKGKGKGGKGNINSMDEWMVEFAAEPEMREPMRDHCSPFGFSHFLSAESVEN